MSNQNSRRHSIRNLAKAGLFTIAASSPVWAIIAPLRLGEEFSQQTSTCKVEFSYLRDTPHVVSRLNVKTHKTHIIETSDCGKIQNDNQVFIGMRQSLPLEDTCVIARGDTITITTFRRAGSNVRVIAQIHSIQKPADRPYSWKPACA